MAPNTRRRNTSTTTTTTTTTTTAAPTTSTTTVAPVTNGETSANVSQATTTSTSGITDSTSGPTTDSTGHRSFTMTFNERRDATKAIKEYLTAMFTNNSILAGFKVPFKVPENKMSITKLALDFFFYFKNAENDYAILGHGFPLLIKGQIPDFDAPDAEWVHLPDLFHFGVCKRDMFYLMNETLIGCLITDYNWSSLKPKSVKVTGQTVNALLNNLMTVEDKYNIGESILAVQQFGDQTLYYPETFAAYLNNRHKASNTYLLNDSSVLDVLIAGSAASDYQTTSTSSANADSFLVSSQRMVHIFCIAMLKQDQQFYMHLPKHLGTIINRTVKEYGYINFDRIHTTLTATGSTYDNFTRIDAIRNTIPITASASFCI